MNREYNEEHHHEEKCLPDSDEIWCDDFWIYIVIAIGGFLFFILAGILGHRRKFYSHLWLNHKIWFIIKTIFFNVKKSIKRQSLKRLELLLRVLDHVGIKGELPFLLKVLKDRFHYETPIKCTT